MQINRIISKINNVLKHPKIYNFRGGFLYNRQYLFHKIAPYTWLDDKFFIEYKFFQLFGETINWKNPKSFNEKLQWIKLFDRNPFYSQLVDKFKVRNFVANKIGQSYLNDLLGIYDYAEDIHWESLPQQFILKTTHGCGYNVIGHNKNKLRFPEVKEKLSKWLNTNYYEKSREWPYKNIKPKIICEKYIPWDPQLGLLDYKIYCFNGQPTFIDVHYGRYTEHKSIFYDTNWKRQPFGLIPKETELSFTKPNRLGEMLEIAQELSKGIPYCRIDLYYVSDKIYFGEITFFPGGGFLPFHPLKYNQDIGNLIVLPDKKIK